MFSTVKILSFLSFIYFVNAQTFSGCDYKQSISTVGRSISLKYPGSTKAGNSCRYLVLAPVNTIIEVSCSFNIAGIRPSCSSQKLSISRSGDLNTRDEFIYCGRGSFLLNSIGNEVVLALRSTKALAGSFQCVLKSVKLTNSNCDCGWNVRGRIVGGSTTGINEFVSHAGLVDTKSKDVFCGAIILNQNWALSAAHCFDAFPSIASTLLLVGDHDLRTGSETIWSAGYLLQSYVKHRSYRSETNANDIALIKTRDYIKFNLGVGPACLPYTFMQNDPYFDGKFLTVVGWGAIEFGGLSSSVLKKAQLKVIDSQTCSRQNNFIDNTKICTSENKSGSSCTKDSGGGLYWISGRQYAIGLVSYGTYCASSIPSVNTRITAYIGWIESYLGGSLCRKS